MRRVDVELRFEDADYRRSLAKLEESLRAATAKLGAQMRGTASAVISLARALEAQTGEVTAEDRLYARNARRAYERSTRNQRSRRRRPHGRPR